MSDIPKQWTCPKCAKTFRYTQSVIMRGMTGHQTPEHECGKGFVAAILKPGSKDAKAFWRRVLTR